MKSKTKKIVISAVVIALAAIAAVLVCVFCFGGKDDNGKGKPGKPEQPEKPTPHTCVFENYVFDVGSATCQDLGTDTSPCSVEGCDKTDTRPSELNTEYAAHDWSEFAYNGDATCKSYGTDSRHCQTTGCDATESRATQINAEYGKHKYEDYVCVNCGKYSDDFPVTDDLQYTEVKSDDEVIGYTVSGEGNVSHNVIRIPETYMDKPVMGIAAEAFSGLSSLKKVILPSSVTSIEKSAFQNCRNLQSIDFAENGKLTSIGRQAFYRCESLTDLNIPSSVTSIDEQAFYACGLTSVTFAEHSKLTSIGNNAFSYCTRITSIDFLGDMASWCKIYGLHVLLSDWTGEKTLKVGGQEIKGDITLPSDVTIINGSAFYNCGGITSVNIPSSVTSIGVKAFYGCGNLTSVIFAENSELTSIEQSAFGKSGITSIDIPSGVTTIGSYAFTNCVKLESITFSENSKLESIGRHAFNNCEKLMSIDIPDSVTSIGNDAFAYCGKLTKIEIPNGIIRIDIQSFYGCSSLTSITIPKSVRNIGSNALRFCSSLTSIVFDGTADEWKAITKGSRWNEYTGNYTVTCSDGTTLTKSESEA